MMTADQLWELDDQYRYDLIEGELITSPLLTGEQGWITANELGYVSTFTYEHLMGTGFACGTGFQLGHNPDTVLAPNGAFVRTGRFDPDGVPNGFVPFAPDWAVEIASRPEGPEIMDRKIPTWLASGVRLLWVIYPAPRTVRVYSLDQPSCTLTEDDTLDGGEVFPGFTLPVRALFED
jgi:Uma2 family endonuclease